MSIQIKSIRYPLIAYALLVSGLVQAQLSSPLPPHRAKTQNENDAAEIAKQARSLIDAGRYADAEIVARSGLFEWGVAGPNLEDLEVKQALAEAMLRQGENFEALRYETEVFDKWHDNTSKIRIGILLCRLGRFDESLGLFQWSLITRFMPSDSIKAASAPKNLKALEGYWLLAAGWSEEGNGYISESYYFEGAAKYIPEEGYLNWLLGNCYLTNGKYPQAVTQLRKAVANNSGTLRNSAKTFLTRAIYLSTAAKGG